MSTDLPVPEVKPMAGPPRSAPVVTFSPVERERIAGLADHLIPGGAGFPSAREADVHITWIDRTLAARPDLVEVVQSVVKAPGDPGTVLDSLSKQNRPVFADFSYVICGAYLINPRVRRLLGYPTGQPVRNPAFPDEADAYLEDGILGPVLDRGPIYRVP